MSGMGDSLMRKIFTLLTVFLFISSFAFADDYIKRTPSAFTYKNIYDNLYLKLDQTTQQTIINNGLKFEDADRSPDAVGELLYDNTVAGFDDGLFAWYDDDEIRYIVDLDTLPGDAEDDYVVSYDKDADKFYMKVDAGAAGGDEVTVNASAVDTTANFLNGDIVWTLTDGGAGGPDDITGSFAADSIDDTHINWGSGAGQVDLADIPGGISGASVWDFGGATSFEVPNGTSGTTDAIGEFYYDSNGDNSTVIDGVLQGYGTANQYFFGCASYPSSDNDVMAYDSATNKVTWQAQAGGAGGGATYREITLLPESCVLDDTNPPLISVKESTGTGTPRFRVAQFDDGEDDKCYWTFVMPSDATASQDLILDIYWYSDEDVAENVVWAVQVSATTPDDADNMEEQAADDADTVTDSADSAEAKALIKATLTIDYANCDGAVAGDTVTLCFYRDGDNGSDSHTNEVFLHSCHLKIPRS